MISCRINGNRRRREAGVRNDSPPKVRDGVGGVRTFVRYCLKYHYSPYGVDPVLRYYTDGDVKCGHPLVHLFWKYKRGSALDADNNHRAIECAWVLDVFVEAAGTLSTRTFSPGGVRPRRRAFLFGEGGAL